MIYGQAQHYAAHLAIITCRPVFAPCVHCDSEGPHEGNGDRVDPTFLCPECGELTDLDELASLAEENERGEPCPPVHHDEEPNASRHD